MEKADLGLGSFGYIENYVATLTPFPCSFMIPHPSNILSSLTCLILLLVFRKVVSIALVLPHQSPHHIPSRTFFLIS